jgi:hypothetical protein
MSGHIERVVVPLDATSDHRTAIDTAARLAARVGAPLHGVFVEDEELLRAAELHFTRQSTLGPGAEPFTRERTGELLRAAAERARRELADVAERYKLASTFETVRGSSERAFVTSTANDLVVAGGLSRPVGGYFRLESQWFRSVEAVSGPFLLARHDWNPDGTVVTLLRDRQPQSVRLLEAAAQIAAAQGGGLTVIAPPEIAGADDFDQWIGERLAAYGIPLQIEVAPAEPGALDRRIVQLDCRLLAIDAKAGGGAARLREYVERVACNILVVR